MWPDRRMTMKRQSVENNGFVSFDGERISRRLENGVEIVESEIKRSIKFEDGTYKMSKLTSPTRLVVSDAINRSKLFVTKSRSQLGDVDSFLRNIIRRPAEAK